MEVSEQRGDTARASVLYPVQRMDGRDVVLQASAWSQDGAVGEGKRKIREHLTIS